MQNIQKIAPISQPVFIKESTDPLVYSGHFYMAFQKNRKWFVYNHSGQSVWINRKTFKWRKTDPFCFLIRVQRSILPSLELGKIYWVFDDRRVDERYLVDNQGRKVLLDQNIVQYEIL